MSEQLEKDFEFVNGLMLSEKSDIIINALYKNVDFIGVDSDVKKIPKWVVSQMGNASYRKNATYLVVNSPEIVWYLLFRCGVAGERIFFATANDYKEIPFPQVGIIKMQHINDFNSIKVWVNTMGKDILSNLSVIGNPAYNKSANCTGGIVGKRKGKQTISIYHHFMESAIEMGAKTVCLIVKSQWLNGGGDTKKFYSKYINSTKFKMLTHWHDSKQVFDNVNIEGGVNWFLYDRDYNGQCEIVVRDNAVVVFRSHKNLSSYNLFGIDDANISSLMNKIQSRAVFLDSQVFSLYSFSDKTQYDTDDIGTTIQDSYPTIVSNGGVYEYRLVKKSVMEKLVVETHRQIIFEVVNSYKVCIAKANGSDECTPRPFILSPGEAWSGTFIVLHHSKFLNECENFVSYMNTRLFQFLFAIKKSVQGQNITKSLFKYIPIVDCLVSYNDAAICELVGLTNNEIAHVNYTISKSDSLASYFQRNGKKVLYQYSS
jgi:site-specific DNA-methyltransferase (adenine-specific)